MRKLNLRFDWVQRERASGSHVCKGAIFWRTGGIRDAREYMASQPRYTTLAKFLASSRASLAESRSDKRKRRSLREALSEIETPSHATR